MTCVGKITAWLALLSFATSTTEVYDAAYGAWSVPVAAGGLKVIRIASVKELYKLQGGSNQHVVLAPGHYPINLQTIADFGGTWPSASCATCKGCVALFNFSGSNNIWDMSGAIIMFDTTVLREYHCKNGPHGTGNLLGGNNNVWRGLTWQEIPPLDKTLNYAGFFPGSGATFVLQGVGHVVDSLRISVRGSGLYGFGALYGKGSGDTMPGVTKSKRSLLAIVGARDILIKNCHFDNSAFGHLIHIHDRPTTSTLPHTYNITIMDSTVTGQVRSTDDLISNGVGGVDRNGVPFRVRYEDVLYAGGPPGAVAGAAGQAAFAPVFKEKLDGTAHCTGPIARGKAFALTECGLRFYDNVSFVSFVNISNYQTRCGACLGSGIGGAVVDQLAVRSIAPHGYAACAVGEKGGMHSELGESFEPPSNSQFTRCSGDATYAPLLNLVGDKRVIVNVTGDFELLAPERGHAYGRTSDVLADIAGEGHSLRLWGSGGESAKAAGLRSYIGHTKDASNISLCNLLPTPVLLGNRSSGVRLWSVGEVKDGGRKNSVVMIKNVPGAHLPRECAPFKAPATSVAAPAANAACIAALRQACPPIGATHGDDYCSVCAGQHQHTLRAASCSAADCTAYCHRQSPAFQPYSAHGNTIHVTTADFDGVGARDFVVVATTTGVISAYQRPDSIVDPAADNRLWSYDTGVFALHLASARLSRSQGARDHILVPGADGHLRVLDSDGHLLYNIPVGSTNGSVYAADAGFTSRGFSRIVAGGVDGNVYVYHGATGKYLGLYRPHPAGSIVRRLVVGNFDGIGGGEVAVFFNRGGFSGGGLFTFVDLDTLSIANYWNFTGTNKGAAQDDVTALGWTDKQLPCAFDMDDDGDDELVAHWGALHPTTCLQNLDRLSKMVRTGERLRREEEYDDVHAFTPTNKYIMQKGVAGRFTQSGNTGMVTVYGDDLYYLDYNLSLPREGKLANRFRVTDYGYAHTLFHFTDGARLESRIEGGLDRIVLSGPNNGDDRWYLVDLAAGDGQDWKDQAKTIDVVGGGGKLGEIRRSLQTVVDAIDDFKGAVVADGGPINYIMPVNMTATGWKLNDLDMAKQADLAADAMRDVYLKFFGTLRPKKVTIWADISLDTKKNINASCAVRWVSALARRGVHMQIIIGHGARVFVTPDELGEIYRASIVESHSYVVLATKELQEPSDPGRYAPLMDVLLSEASRIGLPPTKLMLSEKGALFTGMNYSQFAELRKYRDVMILGAENSDVRLNEWCLAERASLWITGAVGAWSGNPIGDHVATNRISEWSAMRNGHMVFRQLLSTFVLGATWFRSDVTIPYHNPLYLRGDTNDPKLALGNGYRQGIVPFLRLVEAGVFPSAPIPSQLKGISPVAIAIPSPNERFGLTQAVNHDWSTYTPQQQQWPVNHLQCWYAYTQVPDYDITAIVHGSTRRWDSLFPHSTVGFVPIVPFASRAALESNYSWCDRAYETDVNTWVEFGQDLEQARDIISSKLLSQVGTNAVLAVEPADPGDPNSGKCFWQLTAAQSVDQRSTVMFLLLMDPGALDPLERRVTLRLGSAAGAEHFEVFDQFGSQTMPIAALHGSDPSVPIAVPAGAMRFLTLRRSEDNRSSSGSGGGGGNSVSSSTTTTNNISSGSHGDAVLME